MQNSGVFNGGEKHFKPIAVFAQRGCSAGCSTGTTVQSSCPEVAATAVQAAQIALVMRIHSKCITRARETSSARIAPKLWPAAARVPAPLLQHYKSSRSDRPSLHIPGVSGYKS